MVMISVKFDTQSIIDQLDLIRLKQLPFATSLAINNTLKLIKLAEEREILDVFDRPTPYVQNSLFIKPSTKQTLTGEVKLKDVTFKGNPATRIFKASIEGGERKMKAYEKLLNLKGILPNGYVTVPGDAADIDQYGNVKPAQIRQILSYFQSNRDSGSISNSTDATRAKLKRGTKKKAGISYFAGAPAGGKLPLGIWQLVHTGFGVSSPRPILIFVKSTQYEKIFDFEFVAKNVSDKNLDNEFDKAMQIAIRTAR